MLPQSSIWQSLRQAALETIPDGCKLPYSSPFTLDSWLREGAFNVGAVTARGFVLNASTAEIGSALLSESLLSADRALEHSITLRNQLSCHRWSSPTWKSVTFYYWAYHVAVALTRLLGKSSWFISSETAAQLSALATVGNVQHGAGPYVVECGQQLSGTVREVSIQRSKKTRSHETTWSLWHSRMREVTSSAGAKKRGDDEARFYFAIMRAANALGDTWPSELRNAINYSNWLGYGAVRKQNPTAVFSIVLIDPPSSVQQLIDRLEGNAAGLSDGQPLAQQLPTATRVLVDLAIGMHLVYEDLIGDVLSRRVNDRRWQNARAAFAKSHNEGFNVKRWPCDVARE